MKIKIMTFILLFFLAFSIYEYNRLTKIIDNDAKTCIHSSMILTKETMRQMFKMQDGKCCFYELKDGGISKQCPN